MSSDESQIRNLLRDGDFKQLLISNLGWDNCASGHLEISTSETTFLLKPVAQKRGMIVFLCQSAKGQAIPSYQDRLRIEKQVSKSAYEHIIIYTDYDKTRQVWQWVRRQIGKPTASREQNYFVGQLGDPLIQKLRAIGFSLEEEEYLTISDVATRAKLAFDVERVTKRFYDLYKKEHALFLKSIHGISSDSDRAWYASLIFDRLIFIYFIQKKRFLDNDPNYLRNKLAEVRKHIGENKFLSFYQHFLLRLFHEGLGSRARTSELESLLGNVPYLNGGLFEIHELERKNQSIHIPDDAFERIFDFFDSFQWHLDDRPLKTDNEINPDVLGYIFEKYVNQREMGAYYTKDDITEFMARNAIICFIFHAFFRTTTEPAQLITDINRMVIESPRRYLNRLTQFGVINEDGNVIEVPKNILAGCSDVQNRSQWNTIAAPEYGLSSETWREYLARRRHCLQIYDKLRGGTLQSIDDFTTFNLDIRQFAQDFIQECDSPTHLQRIYDITTKVRVLDPTCGSGAFLFQVLNVLEAIYEACLERMEGFVSDDHISDTPENIQAISSFRKTLSVEGQHSNRRYFILRAIMLNSLFGVDLMAEATEICKLRLFLKLAAQIEPDPLRSNLGLEPLPDIDFNIRCGNTLVGFTNYERVKESITSGQLKLGHEEILKNIESRAHIADEAYAEFKDLQVQAKVDDKTIRAAKKRLESSLRELAKELDEYLALDYKVNPHSIKVFQKWLEDYNPFHWFLEFYTIMKTGGFDIIIGNPPYLESNEVPYAPLGFACQDSRAIHAMCIERSLSLLQLHGTISMIVPLSLVSTQRMKIVQDMIESGRNAWYSNYSWRPGRLFDTVNRALTIFIASHSVSPHTYSTNYQRWNTEYREMLFQAIRYAEIPRERPYFWAPKLGDPIETSILNKILSIPSITGQFCSNTDYRIYRKSTGGLYWKVFTDFPPFFRVNGQSDHSSRETSFGVALRRYIRPMIAILSSDLYWWWYTISTNLRDLNANDINTFPLPKGALDDPELDNLGAEYLQDLTKNSTILVRQQKRTGKTETQSFKIQKSKAIVNKINAIVGKHYQFSDEQLDFLSNYDIKFRLSVSVENDGQE